MAMTHRIDMTEESAIWGGARVAFAYADGHRTSTQQVTDDGIPVWNVNLLLGNQSGVELTTVKLAQVNEPKISPMTPVQVEGLTVKTYQQRDGGTGLTMWASSIMPVADARHGGEN